MTKQEYEAQHKKLMKEWQEKYTFAPKGEVGQFVPDGVVSVDAEHYFNQKKKILFMLKEANNGDGNYTERGICDEVITSTNSGKTWFNPSRWIQVILDETSLEQMRNMTSTIQHEQMKRVAVMNMKKASGGSHSNDKKISEWVEGKTPEAGGERKELIKKQIDLCKPDIIIACGAVVFETLKRKVFEEGSIEDESPIEGMHWGGEAFRIKKGQSGKEHVSDTDTLVVKYRHPSYCSIEKSYQDMVKIRKELMK